MFERQITNFKNSTKFKMGNEPSMEQVVIDGRRYSYAIPEEDTIIRLSGEGISELPPHVLEKIGNVLALYLNRNKIRNLPINMPQLRILELGSNELSEANVEILQQLEIYISLEDLCLSNNNFKTIPAELLEIPRIKTLRFSGNHLTEIPNDITPISRLDASQNDFTEFPKVPKTLKELDLSSNRFTNITITPNNLTRLRLSMCGITKFVDIAQMPFLKELDLSMNPIETMPNLPLIAPSLVAINLSSTNLTNIPELSPTVEKIFMDHCKLLKVPSWISTLPALHTLRLRNNQLKEIPKLPPTLETLKVAHNEIEAVEVCELPNLTYLDMSHNKLKHMPNFGNHQLNTAIFFNNNLVDISLPFIAPIVHLDLGHNSIKEIPAQMFKGSQLRALNLSINKLMELPCEIKQSHLTHLNVSFNDLGELPDLPPSLVVLYATHCKLLRLPDNFDSLMKLKKLLASFNEIEEVSIPFNCQFFALCSNQIRKFPPFGPDTRWVDLSMNSINSLDDSINSLDNLEYLDLSRNRIKTIPPTLCLPSLKTLKLQLNPVEWIFNKHQFPSLADLDAVATQIHFDGGEPDLETFRVSKNPAKSIKCVHTTSVPWVGYTDQCAGSATQETSIAVRTGIKEGEHMFLLFEGLWSSGIARFASKRIVANTAVYSSIVSKAALKQMVTRAAEEAAERQMTGGSNAVAVTLNASKLVMSTCGEARCAIIDYRGKARLASPVHKLFELDEVERIHEAGGLISNKRLQAVLPCGRAVGFFGLKGVTAETDERVGLLTNDDRFAVIGSSTLFKDMPLSFIAQLCIGVASKSPRDIAYLIRAAASAVNHLESTSVIVIDLKAARGVSDGSKQGAFRASCGVAADNEKL